MNAAFWRNLILTLVIAAAAGFAGAKLGQVHHAGTPLTAVSRGTVRQSVDALLDREFKLTDQQKQQIQAIDERFTHTHNLIWADIRMSNAELAAAVANDMSLNPGARKAIVEIQNSVGQLNTVSIQYVLDVRKVLTPQQRATFDEHVVMALMRDPE